MLAVFLDCFSAITLGSHDARFAALPDSVLSRSRLALNTYARPGTVTAQPYARGELWRLNGPGSSQGPDTRSALDNKHC
jgi:hypothetical protein